MNVRLCTILAAGGVLSVAAHAEVAPGGWVDTRVVGTELEMRDTITGRALLARETLSMFAGFPAGVTTDVQAIPAADGADLRFTFRNTSGTPKRLGRINLGILNLGENIEYLNFRHTSTPTPAHASTHVGWAAMYPNDLYSPVAVLRNNSIGVGMSIQYPVMDYKHDVRIEISSPGAWLADGEAGRGWMVSFGLSNINQEGPLSTILYEASLAPAEERVYTVSVRFTRQPGEWQGTLVPYRDYFRETYGPVKYQRDTTPVLAYALSDPANISAVNPLGYRANHRPDLNGFAGVMNELRTYSQWPTIMLWAPTGLYRVHRDLNWPYQFASHWDTTEQQRTAFSGSGFPSLAARGQNVGMWWGRSLSLASSWDTAESTPFDPSNQQHRTIAFRELDAAARAGATWIGLDTFGHTITPIWESRQWLRDMQARQPQMHFVTEPSMCDIMHVEAPTFVSGWNEVTSRPANRSDLFNITSPNYLADFLLPGHEIWGAYRYSEHTRFFGAPSNSQVRADMQYVASLGYRPCFAIDYFTPQGIETAPSWETSVPQAVRAGDTWMADIRAGRRPGQAEEPTDLSGTGGGGSNPGTGGGPGSSPTSGSEGGTADAGGSDTPPQAGGGTGPRNSIIRVRPRLEGSTSGTSQNRRSAGSWRELVRRSSATYQVQRSKGAGERLKDDRNADAGGN